MKAIVQRVQNASVTVDGLVISAIGSGLLVWVGFGSQDNSNDLSYMVNTLLTTRFFHSEHNAHRWTRNVMDCNYEVLVLSQISLYSTMYLQKPYFYQAMNARRSKPYYERFVRTLRKHYKSDKIREGRFGAGYTVTTKTRGPVFVIESAFGQPQGGFPGAMGPPPPYPYPQPPVYGAPQAPVYSAPQPPPAYSPQYKYPGYAHAHAHGYPSPANRSYEGLPPLRPVHRQQDYDYPNY